MRCSVCAAELLGDAVFCHQCGTQIATDSEPAPAQQHSPQHFSPQQLLQSATSGIQNSDDEPEQEIWQGSFSKLAMIGSWIGATLFSLILLVVAVATGFSSTGWIVSLVSVVLIWIALLARLFYRQLSEHYYLTNQRFVHEKGLLWREIDRIEAIDIDDVSFQQGPIERSLGVGTISIRSSDQTHPEIELLGIEKVREVAGMIDEARRQERRKRGLYVEAV